MSTEVFRLRYQCSFGSGGTGVDSQETFSLICRKVAGFYLVGTLAVVESLIVVLCGKKVAPYVLPQSPV